MRKKTFIWISLIIIVSLVIVGYYWTKLKKKWPLKETSQLENELTEIKKDISELEELATDTPLENLDQDLTELSESKESKKNLPEVSLENLENELESELNNLLNDINELNELGDDSSLDNLDSSLSNL